MFPELLTINVTQEHINAGIPEDCQRCPIALATLDALQAWPTVSIAVDDDRIELENGYTRAIYPLPADARAFVSDFDSIDSVIYCEPFTFDVESVTP